MAVEAICAGCGERFTYPYPSKPRRYCAVACYDAHRPPRFAFWPRIDASGGPDKCWPWVGRSLHPFGYGVVRVAGKSVTAARRAYELTYGEIAPGLVVRHDCDNPICCNPGHLRVGTRADNNRDTWTRGRHPWVHNNPSKRRAA